MCGSVKWRLPDVCACPGEMGVPSGGLNPQFLLMSVGKLKGHQGDLLFTPGTLTSAVRRTFVEKHMANSQNIRSWNRLN